MSPTEYRAQLRRFLVFALFALGPLARVLYIGHFFEAAENPTKLLKQFDADCVGPQ